MIHLRQYRWALATATTLAGAVTVGPANAWNMGPSMGGSAASNAAAAAAGAAARAASGAASSASRSAINGAVGNAARAGGRDGGSAGGGAASGSDVGPGTKAASDEQPSLAVPPGAVAVVVAVVNPNEDAQMGQGGHYDPNAPQIQVGTPVNNGDTVWTDPDAEVTLQFPDGSVVTVGGGTQVTLHATSTAVSVALQQKVQEIAGQVNMKAGVSSDFRIQPATPTTSIRG